MVTEAIMNVIQFPQDHGEHHRQSHRRRVVACDETGERGDGRRVSGRA
jgi:hypothetical protein